MICKNCLSTDIKKIANKANIYICNDCGKLLLKPKRDKFAVIYIDNLNKRMMVQCNYGGGRDTCKNRPLDFEPIDITYL